MTIKDKKGKYIPIKKINDKNVVIMWDYTPITATNAKGELVDTPLAMWQEHRFKHIPTIQEIKNTINDYYNNIVDKKILTEFVWKGMNVWLSTENQFNYKAAYDLAVQYNGATLPITFKFDNGIDSVFYEFKTLEDITDFYLQAIKHIKQCLEYGWDKKNAINWEFYQIS